MTVGVYSRVLACIDACVLLMSLIMLTQCLALRRVASGGVGWRRVASRRVASRRVALRCVALRCVELREIMFVRLGGV